MQDDFQYQQTTVQEIRGDTRDLTDPSCLPETGPYTFQLRDLLLDTEMLTQMLTEYGVKASNLSCKEYNDTKNNRTVYTYFLTVETLDEGITILAMNGTQYEGAPLNSRYWVPKPRGPRRDRGEEANPMVSFHGVKDQRGTVQIEAKQQETYERPSFKRDESGLAPQQRNDQPVSFKNARGEGLELPAQERKQFTERKPVEQQRISFKRDEFGTGLQESDKRPRNNEKRSNVTLDFGRK